MEFCQRRRSLTTLVGYSYKHRALEGVSNLHIGVGHGLARGVLYLQTIRPIDEVLGGAVIRVLSMQICRISCRATCKNSVEKVKIGDVATPIGTREGHIA